MTARAVSHHNAVLRAAQTRALGMEARLAAILEPILNDAGDEAARRFLQIVRPVTLASEELTASAECERCGGLGGLGQAGERCTDSQLPAMACPCSLRAAAPAAADVHELSTMIAVKPTPEQAEALAAGSDHDAADMHVTLAYLGDVEGDLRPLLDVLQLVAASHAPLEGTVGGVGVFADNGKGHPSILLPSVPGLVELRVEVTEALADAGYDYGRVHGFQPHMTHGYIPTPDTPPVELLGLPLSFLDVCVVRGNVEEHRLPLVGGKPVTASAEKPPLGWINRYDLFDLTYETFAGQHAGWAKPSRDELLDADALADRIREKTQPLMYEVVKTVVTAGLHTDALTAAGGKKDPPSEPSLSWDVTNPFTAKVLSQTGSQVTNISKTTQAGVMASVDRAYNDGMSIPQTADLIREGMRDASPARATLIARTELAGAVNGGSLAATQIVADATGLNMTKEWLTAPGALFPRHETYDGLDGQTMPLEGYFNVGGAELQFPGDPAGPPEEVCNCFPAETVVRFPGLRAVMRRRYDGDLVRLRTAAGDELAGTPNHPVLRADGVWVPLGSLDVGDHLIRADVVGQDTAAPHEQHPPSSISEVYGFADEAAVTERVVLRPGDLHGDTAAHDEVDVVSVDGVLLHDNEAASDEEVTQFGFALADAARAGARGREAALAGPMPSRDNDVAATGSVRVDGKRATLVLIETGQAQPKCGAVVAPFDPELGEPSVHDGDADAEARGDLGAGGSLLVSTTEIVHVEVESFHGDVFNLDTGFGWYTAGSLVAANCRCTIVYVEAGEAVATGDADEQLDPQSAADEAAAAVEESDGGGEPEEGTGEDVPPLPSFSTGETSADLGGGALTPADEILEGSKRMQIEGESIPIYRTEDAAEAYKGKAVWGEGRYYGTDLQETADLQLDPELAMPTDFGDVTKVDTYQLPANARILEIDADKLTDEQLRGGYSGAALRRKTLDGGYDGVHIITESPNLGGDQIVLYRSLADIQKRRDLARERHLIERRTPPPVVPPPAVEPPPAIAAPADRPYAHIKQVTLDTQLYRTKKLMTDMLGKPSHEWTAKMNADYEKARVKLEHLDREKAYRQSLPERPYAHYAPATLKTQLYRVNKRIAELDPRKASLTVQERGEWNQLHDKLRGLLAEQKSRGVEPSKKPGMKVTTKTVEPPPVPSVKPPANERMARLQEAYARRGDRTLTLTDPAVTRYSDAENYGYAIHEVEQELTALGSDVRAEIDARLEARMGSARFANYDDRRDALVEVLSEVRSLGRGGIEMGDGNDVFVNAKATRTDAWKSVNKMADKYLPTDWLKNMTRPLDVGKSQRGYFRRYGGRGGAHEIKVSSRSAGTTESRTDLHARVAIHELGHLMEEIVPGIRTAEMAFYGRRTIDSTTGELEMLRRYKWGSSSEKVRPDRFMDEYMGKTYGDGWNSSYEVLSMGLDSLFTGTNNLWAGDPDMANFILGLLVGV